MTRSKGILPRVPHQFKDKRQAAFLKAYAKLGTVRAACEAAGISRSTHDRWKERDETYVARYAAAGEEFADAIEAAVVQRVKEGELEYIANPRTGIAYELDKQGNPILSKPIMQRRSNAQRDLAVLRRFKPEYREEAKLEVSGGVVFSKPQINVALIREVVQGMVDFNVPPLPPANVIEGEAREVELPAAEAMERSAPPKPPDLSVVDNEDEE